MQPAHALAEFAIRFPNEFKNWQINHKNLVVVAASDEEHLKQLEEKFLVAGIKYIGFNEPDIDNQLTALAIEPSLQAYKLTSMLPLALKT